MKAAELRDKTVEELRQELLRQCEDHFKLNVQRSTQQVKQPHMLAVHRHNIARIKTILREKEKEGE